MTDEKERFEILMEHMDGKIDVVLEGHQVLRRDIEGVREEARELNQRTNRKLDLVAINLREQIAGNRERIDAHDKKLDRVIGKIENHDQRIRRPEPV